MGVVSRFLERVFAVQPWEPDAPRDDAAVRCCQPVVRGVRMLNARPSPGAEPAADPDTDR